MYSLSLVSPHFSATKSAKNSKFFGCQRQRGGASSHPNVAEFTHNTQALRVVNTFCRAPTKGNCRLKESEEQTEKENEPLPKRRTRRVQKSKENLNEVSTIIAIYCLSLAS